MCVHVLARNPHAQSYQGCSRFWHVLNNTFRHSLTRFGALLATQPLPVIHLPALAIFLAASSWVGLEPEPRRLERAIFGSTHHSRTPWTPSPQHAGRKIRMAARRQGGIWPLHCSEIIVGDAKLALLRPLLGRGEDGLRGYHEEDGRVVSHWLPAPP